MRKQHGIITVMVTLLMVPMVVISGLMVDASRIKMYSSQAAMAADSYAEAVLSEYEYILKDIYGLYSVTQEEELSKIAEEMEEYAKLSFQPNGKDSSFTGFMPYKNADVDFSCEAQEGASLSNEVVLMTQISQFMKYRIAQILLENSDLLEQVGNVNASEADLEAIEARENLTETGNKVLDKMKAYYDCLEKINDYPSYIAQRKDFYKYYANVLKNEAKTDEYELYYKYRQAEKKKENHETLTDEEIELLEGDTTELEEYVDELKEDETLKRAKEKANTIEGGKLSSFDNINGFISQLESKAYDVTNSIFELENVVNDYKQKIEACEDETQKKNMRSEIENLEKIMEQKDNFINIYQSIENVNHDTQKNNENISKYVDKVNILDEYYDDLLKGDLDPNTTKNWEYVISLQWYSFRENGTYNSFYQNLEQMFKSESSKNAKKEADKKIEELKKETAEADKVLEEDEETNARSISDIPGLSASLIQATEASGELKKFTDYFADGFSFQGLKNLGSRAVDQVMVSCYDFEMFSSRVSGQEPKTAQKDSTESNESEETNSSGDYKDYTLTQVEMNRDANYMYQAEIEYLIAGKSSSKDNLNEVRNVICGVQGTLNFLSTFRINEINQLIEASSNAIAAATGPAAPVVKIAVSGAMRLAIASLITVDDWTMLKQRESIVMLKKSLPDISDSVKERIEAITGRSLEQNTGNSSFKISYEQYAFVLMCLLTSSSDLMQRTSDLITLNVNQAKAEKGAEITADLSFKMKDTVTAVKTTCKVKSEIAITPQKQRESFLGDEGKGIIDRVGKRYWGYSVVRGY